MRNNRPMGLTYKTAGKPVKIYTGRPGRPAQGTVVTNLRNRWGVVVACVVRLRNGIELALPSRRVKVLA